MAIKKNQSHQSENQKDDSKLKNYDHMLFRFNYFLIHKIFPKIKHLPNLI